MNNLEKALRSGLSVLVMCILSFCSTTTIAQVSNGVEEPRAPAIHRYFGLDDGDYLRSDAGALEIRPEAWASLSANLVEGLKGDRDSIKAAAMRLVIQYHNMVEVSDAVFDVVRIYRNHDSDRMRQMAVVTLGAIGDEWALDFLKRSLPEEESTVLRRTIRGVLLQHEGR